MTADVLTPLRHARVQLAAALLCLSVFAAACGDDDVASTNAVDDLATFCETSLEVVELGRADSGDEGDLDAAMAYADAIVPAARRMLAATPPSVRSDVETMLAAAEAAAASGDASGFGSPEFAAAEANWHEAGVEACDWNIAAVTLTEYQFDGIPDTLPPGVTSFEMTNAGSEFHVLSVLRRNDGVATDFDELLALPDDAGVADMTEVGSGFVAPGEVSYALADLTPGDYIVICPIPVGAGDGPPAPDAHAHYQEGMQHRFTVS